MAVSPPATSVPSSGTGSTPMNSVIWPQKLSISSRAVSRSSSYSPVQVAQTLNLPGNVSLSSETQSSSHSGSSSCLDGVASTGSAPNEQHPNREHREDDGTELRHDHVPHPHASAA